MMTALGRLLPGGGTGAIWRGVALALLAVYLLAIAGVAVAGAVRGTDGIYEAFTPDGFAVTDVAPDGPGARAGVRAGDLILSIDGVAASDTDTFLRLSGPGWAGGPETLQVRHRLGEASNGAYGPTADISLNLTAFAADRAYLVRLISFGVVGILFMAVAAVVSLGRPDDVAARLLVSMVSAGAYALLAALVSDVVYSPWCSRAVFLLGVLACVAMLHFFLAFPAVHPWLAKLKAVGPPALRRFGGGVALLYLPPFALTALLTIDVNSIYPQWSYAIDAAYLVAALVALIRGYWHPPTPLARAQLKWILWAFAIGVAGWIGGAVVPLVAPALPQVLFLALGVAAWAPFPVAIGFAVLRYRLFDVDRVVQATVLYAVLAALLALGYVALTFGATLAVTTLTDAAALPAAGSILIALVIAALAHPARQRVQAALDRLFYRDRLARRQLLQEADEVFSRALAPAAVANFLARHVARRLDFTGAWLVAPGLLDGRPGDGLPAAPAALLDLLRAAPEPVLLSAEAIGGSPLPVLAADAPAVAPWYAAGARLLIPLRVEAPRPAANASPAGREALERMPTADELIGVWAVGARRSQQLYDREDLSALAHVGQRASVMLDYARLHREQIDHEVTRHEVARARAIQQQLLPAALPGWPGLLEVAARLQPAREMSGDFYDVLALPASASPGAPFPPLQVAVGDVAGKSIPAALVMAQAQTALRSVAQMGGGAPVAREAAPGRPALAPARSLQLVGRLLHHSAGRRNFVACALAVLEPGDEAGAPRLRLANAGQAPPLLCRAGAAQELEPPGEHLPLGVLPEPRYDEVVVTLRPGDTLVFASDGLPEAPARAAAVEAGLVAAGVATPAGGAADPAAAAPPGHTRASGEMFGFERLAASAARWSARAADADAVAAGIWSDLTAWCGSEPHHDDMTLVVVRLRTGAAASTPEVDGPAGRAEKG